ncbi:MAG: class I SAM-dependent methyltransferase [Paludibacteraceae bacterium]|nr:class I SAM-dependent methyltransferase [Paludibacteraceae bacterium]
MIAIHLYYIKRYLQFLLKSHSTRGFGIHSPFVFDFVTNTLGETHPYYIYSKIERLRRNLLFDESEVYVNDYGTGKSGNRKIAAIAGKSLKPANQAQALHRIAVRLNPRNIIELGTSLGTTTAYLAASDSRRTVYTIEGSDSLLNVARTCWRNLQLDNIESYCGSIESQIDNVLQKAGTIGMAFVDANHTNEATTLYWEKLSAHTDDKSFIVFDDIHWSPDMENAWQKICINPKVTLSLDLYYMGIVFFNRDLPHESYQIRL